MAEARLDGAAIKDFESFHDQCAREFGFPAFYGRNMNAWVDCLTYLRESDGMTRFVLGRSETLLIEVVSTDSFRRYASEVFDAFVDGTAFVNQRHVDAGELPAISVLFR